MNDDTDRDLKLPWEYVLLGFLWGFALLAACILLLVSVRGMVPAEVRDQVRPFLIGYLSIVAVLTPLLIFRGRRRLRATQQPPPYPPQSSIGPGIQFTRNKGMNISLTAMCLAGVPIFGTLTGIFNPLIGMGLTIGLIATGVIGMVISLLR